MILELHRQGLKGAAIARQLGGDRKTVRKHISRSPALTAPRIVSGPTLLTGICFCAACGMAMTLRTGKSGRYRYYTCSTKARQAHCPFDIAILKTPALAHLGHDASQKRSGALDQTTTLLES